jgi:hypothetical protein
MIKITMMISIRCPLLIQAHTQQTPGLTDEDRQNVGQEGETPELEQGPAPGVAFAAGDGDGGHAGGADQTKEHDAEAHQRGIVLFQFFPQGFGFFVRPSSDTAAVSFLFFIGCFPVVL